MVHDWRVEGHISSTSRVIQVERGAVKKVQYRYQHPNVVRARKEESQGSNRRRSFVSGKFEEAD